MGLSTRLYSAACQRASAMSRSVDWADSWGIDFLCSGSRGCDLPCQRLRRIIPRAWLMLESAGGGWLRLLQFRALRSRIGLRPAMSQVVIAGRTHVGDSCETLDMGTRQGQAGFT